MISTIYYWEWFNHSVATLFLSATSALGISKLFKLFYYGFILISLILLFYTFNKGSKNFILEVSSLSILMNLIPSMSWDYNLVVLGFVFLSLFVYLSDNLCYGTSFYKTTFIILVLIAIILSDHFKILFNLESQIVSNLFMRIKILSLISILFFNMAYLLGFIQGSRRKRVA